MQSLTHRLPTLVRGLLGASFLVFGLNGFLQFLPMPPPANPAAGAFMGALGATGYMFPLIKGIEVLAGALLLAGRFTPLALLLLAPVVVNILAYHLFLAPEGLGLPIVLTAMGLYVAWNHREVFAPLFQRAATRPTDAEKPRTFHRPAHAVG